MLARARIPAQVVSLSHLRRLLRVEARVYARVEPHEACNDGAHCVKSDTGCIKCGNYFRSFKNYSVPIN